ncbi:MAG TPA: ABC transporter ATP-binding protein [Thermoplasmata archaeon]|jgi:oligopeptide/dipeptide ABC transporter ATP-binding protein|nr:ABC transporter ATP-binding protein [Thermoplasmata archaeon]
MDHLVEVTNLKKYFYQGGGPIKKKDAIKALDDVSFFIKRNEILGLVGESGCGKTTCGKLILRLINPTAGTICFDGQDITHLKQKKMTEFRKKMMIIYQDPYGSLDPRMTIGAAIAEPMEVHKLIKTKDEKENRIIELMEKVGLTPDQINRYPHEFSGGQRQRIGIARALATNPTFIVADEPVSALDVSIQAQIINLLKDLQKDFGLTLLFITHDLSVIKHTSDRIAVMYAGKLVELASKQDLFSDPLHPYTQALLSAIPVPDPDRQTYYIPLAGEVPSLIHPPPGCRFHPRCTQARPECSTKEPDLLEVKKDHFVSCFPS